MLKLSRICKTLTSKCINTRVHAHTCIHTYIHTHVHTCAVIEALAQKQKTQAAVQEIQASFQISQGHQARGPSIHKIVTHTAKSQRNTHGKKRGNVIRKKLKPVFKSAKITKIVHFQAAFEKFKPVFKPVKITTIIDLSSTTLYNNLSKYKSKGALSGYFFKAKK
jgi:hypothetical protein